MSCSKHVFPAATFAEQLLYLQHLQMCVVDIDQQPVLPEFLFQTSVCHMQATFGDQLLEVQQVDQIDTSASVESVNSHLDMLRPASQGYVWW
jgi:hypothetical protein